MGDTFAIPMPIQSPDATQPNGAPARKGPVITAVATLLTLVATSAVVGAFAPRLPYLSIVSALLQFFVDWPWIVILALVGGGLAFRHWRVSRSRYAALLTSVAAATATGASVITARIVAAVDGAGADVRVLGALNPVPLRPETLPEDVPYLTENGTALVLSVFRPRAGTPGALAPVLFNVHGGGWTGGSRKDQTAEWAWFAKHGWLVISADYGLSSDQRHLWDVVPGELGCALAWVAAHAAGYGGDPERLAVTGGSAGGNLAVNAAYMANAGTLLSACGGTVPKVRAVSALVPAVTPAVLYDGTLPFFGSGDRKLVEAYTGGSPGRYPDRYRFISAETHLSDQTPPTLLLAGGIDHVVATPSIDRFAKVAAARGVAVLLVHFPYGDHGFAAPPNGLGSQAYRQLTVNWFREHGLAP
jgi:acetyl esterase/lipase